MNSPYSLQIPHIILIQLPAFLIIIFACLWIITGKWEYGYFVIGVIINAIINQILKTSLTFLTNKAEWIQRPKGATNCGSFVLPVSKIAKSSGMPSGHAQFAGFMLVYGLMYLLKGKNNKKLLKNLSISLIVIISLLIALHRSEIPIIGIGCHTYSQVIVGFIIGAFIGYGTYTLTEKYR